jgi:hypothetical protein
MSVLPPEVHSALTQLLHALSSPDNTTRAHAEEQLNSEWIGGRPDVLLMGLVEQLQSSVDPTVGIRSSACAMTVMLIDCLYRRGPLQLCFSGAWQQRRGNYPVVTSLESCF